MLENLQKGDKLFKEEEKYTRKMEIVEVLGSVVCIKGGAWNGVALYEVKMLEEEGWQLEKKKWVPQDRDAYCYFSDTGYILTEIWTSTSRDFKRQEFNNVFSSTEEAKAYRNKLVEVMGRDGV